MKKWFWQVFAIVWILCLSSQVSFAAVGKVIIAKGETYAIDTASNSRPLKRRSEVMEGDTLITGASSEIHIRFNDNAVLALRADSSLKISEYHAADSNQEEKVLMELLSGGFRTITGAFGKTDKEAYQIRTPNASIGIRGTNYEALLSDNDLLVGVYYGGVRVQNAVGSIDLGLDSAFSFAQVNGNGGNIQGLVEPPSGLTEPLATSFNSAPAVNDEAEEESTGNIQQEDEQLLVDNVFDEDKDPLTASEEVQAEPEVNLLAGVQTPDAGAEDVATLTEGIDLAAYHDLRLTQNQIQQLKDGAPVGFVVVNQDPTGYSVPSYILPNSLDLGDNGFTTSGTLSFDLTLKTPESDFTYTITLDNFSGAGSTDLYLEISNQLATLGGTVNSINVPARVKVSYDVLNDKLVFTGFVNDSGAEIVFNNFQGNDATLLAQELGLCATTCSGTYNLGAPSVGHYEHATHFGYMVTGDDGPVFVNWENESITALNGGYTTPDNVFRGNKDATNTKFTNVDTLGDGTNIIEWGYWNTSATQPALLLKDPENLDNAEAVDIGYFYITAPPAKQADMVGTKTLSQVVDWYATSSTNADLLDASGSATLTNTLYVDFDTAEAYGNLLLSDSSELWGWNLDYYGNVQGAQFVSDWGFGELSVNGGSDIFDAVGHVDGLFTDADTGMGFVGGFGMQTTNDQHHAEGVFFVK